MRLPTLVHKVGFNYKWEHDRPYPPLGFRPFKKGSWGNGDSFGLYWPIGREDQEPLVAEMWHDNWIIQPVYSSLECFLALPRKAYTEPPTLSADPHSPLALCEAARGHIRLQATDEAIQLLEAATNILPEYTEALSWLWEQYARQRRTNEAILIALRTLRSPPSFESNNRKIKVLRWLQKQPANPLVDDDPLWRVRNELKLVYGGSKGNSDYALYLSIIQAYIEASHYVEASTLMQTYAELMYRETVSFQERNNFDKLTFLAWQKEISGQLTNGPRDKVHKHL